eukprot:TRINITY_DN16117_c0_g1_i1.p1 TRINITY_DN16117_c0_g1~~TRINITY_DN16117_c0_g1_i1.p1  ORF type:complete len:221 (-),score=32.07 TRINITY_DN16117_c0_g1_i1:48-710(-)
MSERVSPVPARARAAPAARAPRGQQGPAVLRPRRRPPPARVRSSSVGSRREVQQLPVSERERPRDDHDLRALPVQGEGGDESPDSDSEDEGDDENVVGAPVDASPVATSQATCSASSSSSSATNEQIASAAHAFVSSALRHSQSADESEGAHDESTGADTSLRTWPVRRCFRAVTISDPSQVALSPVPPRTGIERARPFVLFSRHAQRASTLPCMNARHD